MEVLISTAERTSHQISLYFMDASGLLRATELEALDPDTPDLSRIPYGSVLLPDADASGNAVLVFAHPGASDRQDVLVLDKPEGCKAHAESAREVVDTRPGREGRSRVRVPMTLQVRGDQDLPTSVATVRLAVGASPVQPLSEKALEVVARLLYTIRIGDLDGWFEHGSDIFPDPAFRHGFPDIATRDQGLAGIRGPSIIATGLQRCVNEADFRPKRTAPVHPGERVICEIHIGTFTKEGTFDAAGKHMEYLREKGFTTLMLMPIDIGSGSPGWTYDQTRSGAVDATYGGAAGLLDFVSRAHERGLEVILDKQYNHRGPEQDSRSEIIPGMFTRQTIWGPGLSGPEVQHYKQILRLLGEDLAAWVGNYGIDGFRFDATNRLPWEVHEKLAMYGHHIGELTGKQLFLLSEYAESEHPKGRRVPTGCQYTDEAGRYLMKLFGLSRARHITELALDDGSILRPLLKAARRGWWYPDLPLPEGGLRGTERACALLWHHDWIGNRFAGERPSVLLSFALYKALAVWEIFGQWIPLLFMGTERLERTPWFFFTGHQDETTRNQTSAYYESEDGHPTLRGGRFHEFLNEAHAAGLQEAISFSSDGTSAGIEWDAFRSQLDKLGRPYMDHARPDTFDASRMAWDQDEPGTATEQLFEALLQARLDPRLQENDPFNAQYKAWQNNEHVFLLRRKSQSLGEFFTCFNLGEQSAILQIDARGVHLRGFDSGYVVAVDDTETESEWSSAGNYSLWLGTNESRFGGTGQAGTGSFTVTEGSTYELEIPPQVAWVFERRGA